MNARVGRLLKQATVPLVSLSFFGTYGLRFVVNLFGRGDTCR